MSAAPSFALAAALLLTGAPVLAALNCGPAHRGTLGADGITFIVGSRASDLDFLYLCIGDGASDELTRSELDSSYQEYLDAGGDDVLDVDESKILVDIGLAGARVDFDFGTSYHSDMVFKGMIRGADEDPGVDISFAGGSRKEVRYDFHADIRTTGAARGILVGVDDTGPGRRARVRNFGSVVTEAGDDQTSRFSDGVRIRSSHAHVEVTNERGATVETRGKGAAGIYAIAGGTTATTTAKAVNRGSVTTKGDMLVPVSSSFSADAVRAENDQGFGMVEAVNAARATVRTEGVGARGVMAISCNRDGLDGCLPSGKGPATAINRGSVTTTGDGSALTGDGIRGAHGVAAYVGGEGTARAVNEERGTIRTEGTGARGLSADHAGPVGGAEAENEGAITTTGGMDDASRPSHGLNAWSKQKSARAVNHEGATIVTEGVAAKGMVASIEQGAADESATAINHGSVTTRGDGFFDQDSAHVVQGVAAFAGTAGDATVVNTGGVTVSGARATGLYAGTSGTGAATVTMTGGEVVASHADDPATGDVDEGGVGILAETGGAGRVAVRVQGGARVDAPTAVRLAGGSGSDTVTLDVTGGSVLTTLTGHVDLTQAVGGARMTVADGVVIDGAVDFGAGDDELVMQGGGVSGIEGTIRGLETMYKRGAGTARVNDVEFSGSAVNLEEGDLVLAGHLNVGEGTVTVHDGTRLVIEVGDITTDDTRHGRITAGGGVVFQGQDAPVMSMQVASAAAPRRDAIQDRLQEAPVDVLAEGTRVMRRSTAGEDATLVDGEVDLRTGTGSEERDIGTVGADGMVMVRANAGPLAVTPEPSTVTPEPPAPTPESPVVTPEPPVATPEPPVVAPEPPVATPEPPAPTPEPPAAAPEPEPPTPTEPPAPTPEPPAAAPEPEPPTPTEPSVPAPEPSTPSSDGGDSNAGVAFVGGGVLLAALLFDWFDSEEEAEVAAWEEERTDGRTRTSFADLRSGYSHESRSRTGGVEGWTRAYAGDSPVLAGGAEGTARGVAMGLDAELGRGFHLGVAALPDMAASSWPGPASGLGASLEGGWYAARGGWSGRTLFAKTSVSHGRWRAHSLFENPVAGGVLGGKHDLVQNHVGVKAGARLALGGMRVTPSVSLYSGRVHQGAYTAQGAALRAEVPELSQRYRGWKAGLELAPSRWLGSADTLRWRPELRVSTMRTRTADGGVFDLHQSDRAGVLSFTSRARAGGMPRTVHAIGASVTAMRSQGWRLRLGYAGMEVDGEPVHAVAAGLRVRF